MKWKEAIVVGVVLTLFMPKLAAFAEEEVPEQRTVAQSTSQPAPPDPPKIEGSMVGYIDDAIIGSELRIRFEAGWHTQFPDRAEFFYAKCGCYRGLVGTGNPAADPNAPGPHGSATNLNFQQLYFEGEYAPSSRFSFLIEVPVRWLEPQSFVPGTGSFGKQRGLGDVRAGVKVGLFSNENNALTVQMRSYFPSGDASRGLGVNHYSIEPELLYFHRAGHFSIESEFSDWHPIGGSAGVATVTNPNPGSFAGDVLHYGIGPSLEIYHTDRVRVAPVVELFGWSVLGGFQTVAAPDKVGEHASGNNIVNLKAGFRTSIGSRSSIYIGYGRALTDAFWYRDLVRAEYRLTF